MGRVRSNRPDPEVFDGQAYRRIACCIDRDDEADHVLREGLRLCGGEIGSLEVVHIVAPPRTFATSPFAYVAPLV